jgi:predicted transposase/invertase (TIGR01784 family)
LGEARHEGENVKTDSFFNRFFREFPAAFFTLIGEDERKEGKYKFTSVEVKEQAFRFDGVFLPKTKNDRIYFVEAQFKRESDFYARFFGEIFLYLRQYRPANNWRAVVLFPKEAVDPGVPQHYQEFFESGRLQRLYLTRLPKEHLENFPLSLFQIILDSKQEVASTVRKIVRQLPSHFPDVKEQEKIVQMLVNLLMDKLPKLSLKEIKKMIEPLSNIKKSRAYQEIMTEGSSKAKREIAKSLLRKKMSIALISEVTGLSIKEVRALSKELTARKN